MKVKKKDVNLQNETKKHQCYTKRKIKNFFFTVSITSLFCGGYYLDRTDGNDGIFLLLTSGSCYVIGEALATSIEHDKIKSLHLPKEVEKKRE